MHRNRFAIIAVLAAALLASRVYAQEAPTLETERDRLSYAIGADLAKDLRDQSIDVTPELLIRGLSDALSGDQTLMSEEEVAAKVASLRRLLRRKRALAASKVGEENKRAGEAFLAANKEREGVITLDSGLQYKIIEQGDGPKPGPSEVVEAHYRGISIDGAEFDSSYERDEPGIFPLKQIIKGWREALQLMPVGSKWQVFVPPHLAYGPRGRGRQIGPNATLIFDIELLAIENAQAAGENEESVASAPANIKVSFKLDARLMGGSYAQPGWVTPQTYQGIRGQDTVEARAHGLDATGTTPTPIAPKWIPSDPEMVAVSPGEGHTVKITVRSAGESSLKLASAGISKELLVKARYENDAIQVQITQ